MQKIVHSSKFIEVSRKENQLFTTYYLPLTTRYSLLIPHLFVVIANKCIFNFAVKFSIIIDVRKRRI